MIKKYLPEQLKDEFPKLLFYLLLLLFLVLLTHFVLPYLTFLEEISVVSNINLYGIINTVFPVIILFVIFKIYGHISPIIDTLVLQIVHILPGIKKVEEKSIKRILTDFTYIIIVILVATAVSPSLSRFFQPGAIVLNVASLLIIITLLYDTGKTVQKLIGERVKKINTRLKNKKSK